MKKSNFNKFTSACVALMILLVLSLIVMKASDCNDSGGKFVRGLIWFECVSG